MSSTESIATQPCRHRQQRVGDRSHIRDGLRDRMRPKGPSGRRREPCGRRRSIPQRSKSPRIAGWSTGALRTSWRGDRAGKDQRREPRGNDLCPRRPIPCRGPVPESLPASPKPDPRPACPFAPFRASSSHWLSSSRPFRSIVSGSCATSVAYLWSSWHRMTISNIIALFPVQQPSPRAEVAPLLTRTPIRPAQPSTDHARPSKTSPAGLDTPKQAPAGLRALRYKPRSTRREERAGHNFPFRQLLNSSQPDAKSHPEVTWSKAARQN